MSAGFPVDYDNLATSLLDTGRCSAKHALRICEKIAKEQDIPPEDIGKIRETIMDRALPGLFRQIPTNFIQEVIDDYFANRLIPQ